MRKRKLLFKFSTAAMCLLASSLLEASSLCTNYYENAGIVATTPSSDFGDEANGTIIHYPTGLMWQRCTLGQRWDGTNCRGQASTFTWRQALQQAEENTFAERTDWRLPNKNELASIVEYRCYAPAINSQVFPNTLSAGYWTSSPQDTYSFRVWVSDFDSGTFYSNRDINKSSNHHHVRLVRAGQ